jgi:hypothetical protein
MKPTVRVFVSYARANKSLAPRFLQRFREQAGASRSYRYEFWRDTEILVGEQWHGQIEEALAACHLGLLLVSPAFLGSQYIGDHELPRFLGRRGKPVVPVLLQPVDLQHHDLKGLERAQLFRLDRPTFRAPKAYAECSGAQRDQFAHELFRQVEARLDRLHGR